MEWEVGLIESIQNNLGGFSKVFGKIFAFVGGEMGMVRHDQGRSKAPASVCGIS